MLIQTNLGPMTVEQIGDEIDYRSYRNHREMGIQPHRMECVWGTTQIEAMEARFRRELA